MVWNVATRACDVRTPRWVVSPSNPASQDVEQQSPSLVGELACSTWSLEEVFGGQLAPVYEREDVAFSEGCAELFHQVQGERGAARPRRMQETCLRIETKQLRVTAKHRIRRRALSE